MFSQTKTQRDYCFSVYFVLGNLEMQQVTNNDLRLTHAYHVASLMHKRCICLTLYLPVLLVACMNE